MPDNNQFDEFFRNRLLDHSSPVNKGAWKSIHRQLGRVKAFHFWKWYVAGPVVVVVTVIAAHFVLSPVKSPAKSPASSRTADPAAAPAATATASPASIPATAAVPSSTPTTTTSPSPTASTTTTPTSAATRPMFISAAANTTARLSKTTHTTHHRTTHQTSDPAAGAGLNTRTAGNSSISATTPESDPSFSRFRSAALTDPSQATLTSPSQATALAGKDQRQSAPHHLTKPSIVRLSIPAAITAKAPKLSSQALVARPARTRHGLDWSLDAYVSPDFPNKQFGFSYTAGARLTVAFSEHWSATSGFQFSRINAHEVNSTIGLYPGYFNNVDLPVLIGYTFTSKNDLTFTAHAGVIFSLYSQAHGRLTDYPFGSRHGPSAYLGFEISKPLNDQWTIFAEPYGRCLFTSINAFNPYPHEIFTGGLTLGIRYNFGK